MNKGLDARSWALLLWAALFAMAGQAARGGEEARAGRLLGPGVNLRADLGLRISDVFLEPTHASGTRLPTDLYGARHEVEYGFDATTIPLEISLELHPYFRALCGLGYFSGAITADWMAGSAFVAPGDPNEQTEIARLEPGFLFGLGAEGVYPLDVFRFTVGYRLDYGRSILDHQSYNQTSVSGDFSILYHRFYLTAGTRFRFLTPYIGLGGIMIRAAGSYGEHLAAGAPGPAAQWRVRYEGTTPVYLLVGLDASVGEGVAGLQFHFIGEFSAAFYLGVRI